MGMSATPQSAEGSRQAHSDSPNTDTDERHQIELRQAARIEHAARQNGQTVDEDVTGGHRHRLLVAVET